MVLKLAEDAWARGCLLRGEEKGQGAMFHLGTSSLTHLLVTYGYWAVLLFVAIESTGIPFPGETMLLVAAIVAGTTHQLSIALVIVAAVSGAILGDNLGFWVGREGGYRRFAPLRPLYPPRRTPAQTGAVCVPEAWGQSGLLWARRFGAARLGRLVFPGPTACAGHAFCSSMRLRVSAGPPLYGLGGYLLGDNVHRLAGPVCIVTLALAVLLIIAGIVIVRRNERHLEDEAERALPGSLDTYQPGGKRP